MDERVWARLLPGKPVRWARFSLRTLLLAVTVVAVGLAVLAARALGEARRQEVSLQMIEELGGYPVRFQAYGEYLLSVGSTDQRLRPRVYDYVLGKNFFTYAPIIVLGPSVTETKLRAMIPYIEQVRIKEGCHDGETYLALCFEGTSSIDADFIEYLQRRLPQCRVLPGQETVPGTNGT